MHPINMAFNWLNDLPDSFRAGIDFNLDIDVAHRPVSVVSLYHCGYTKQ
jgi:hypothetical protein